MMTLRFFFNQLLQLIQQLPTWKKWGKGNTKNVISREQKELVIKSWSGKFFPVFFH